eukprot:5695761-Pyramimonas_sp.AAC.1
MALVSSSFSWPWQRCDRLTAWRCSYAVALIARRYRCKSSSSVAALFYASSLSSVLRQGMPNSSVASIPPRALSGALAALLAGL